MTSVAALERVRVLMVLRQIVLAIGRTQAVVLGHDCWTGAGGAASAYGG